MPVTIHPAPHGANSPQQVRFVANAAEILDRAAPVKPIIDNTVPQGYRFDGRKILQSSLDSMPPNIIGGENGFVNAAIRAYNRHHHLVIRPEDVWFAVLSQFGFYIVENAESLRQHFVTHQGQKELVVSFSAASKYSKIYDAFAEEIGRKIQENVVDPDLREWIMPAFTTTTAEDRVVASVLLMGAVQKYFCYSSALLCGLPSVTLLGEKADYELILQKLDKLNAFGSEPALFCSLLQPVLRRFVKTFESSRDAEVTEFWQKICSSHSFGSGSTSYSGWITAFCFWEGNGECLYNQVGLGGLELDGVRYHKINTGDVPQGWCEVPVKIVDHGVEMDAGMIAGSVGIQCSSSGEPLTDAGGVGLDSLQPLTGWFMFENIKG